MSVPASRILSVVSPTTAVKVIMEIGEFVACMQGKGQVLNTANKLLKQINRQFNTILRGMERLQQDGREIERLQCMHPLNEYSKKIQLELYPIIADNKPKNKLKRFILRSNYLEQLQNFSQDFASLSTTIQNRIDAVEKDIPLSNTPKLGVIHGHESQKFQKPAETKVENERMLESLPPKSLFSFNEAENALNLPSQAQIEVYARAQGIPLRMHESDVSCSHQSKETLIFSGGPAGRNISLSQQAEISEASVCMSRRPQ